MSDPLDELLAEFIELREAGEAPSPEDFAGQHPALAGRFLAALRRMEDVEGLLSPGDESLPERLGPYRVVEEIGRGGMGLVLRVEHDDHPGRPLALKLLPAVSQLNPRTLERFHREGAALQRLRHPGIVRVHDVGVLHGNPFLVMELVDGCNLEQVIQQAAPAGQPEASGVSALCDRLSLPGTGAGVVRAARLVAGLARAVAAAHAEGLVHRDIKPGNVVLDREGNPVLIDFGLVGGDTGPTITGSGDLLGTPHYMAPEQARGERVDERTDIYGVGAVLYELLTLQPPRIGADRLGLLNRAGSVPARPVRSLDRAVPRDLARVVQRAVSFRPQRRYADAASLAEDLEAFVEGRPLHVPGPGVLGTLEDLWRSHRRPLIVAATLLAVGGVLMFAGWRDQLAEKRRAAYHRWMNRAVQTWSNQEEGFGAAVAELRRLAPQDPVVELLVAHAEGHLLQQSSDPCVAALLDGERKRQAGRTEEALADYLRAVELGPDLALPVVLLAQAAQQTGDLDRAVRELNAAVRRVPDSFSLLWSLGSVYLQQDRAHEAEGVLAKAVQLAPDNARLWFDLALTRYRTEDYEAALEAFERGRVLADRALLDRYINRYAALLDQNDRHAQAQALYRKGLQAFPDSAQYHFDLGLSLDKECRLTEARNEYTSALELDPRYREALICLAWIYAGSNRDSCDRCESNYQAQPELLDFPLAVEFTLRALRTDMGRHSDVTQIVPVVAQRSGARDEILTAVDGLLLGNVELGQEQLANLHRARRALLATDR